MVGRLGGLKVQTKANADKGYINTVIGGPRLLNTFFSGISNMLLILPVFQTIQTVRKIEGNIKINSFSFLGLFDRTTFFTKRLICNFY